MLLRWRCGWPFVAVMSVLFAPTLAFADPPSESRCRIGKPSYCLKYAQMFCPKENSRSDRAIACPAWERACLDCHAAIPQCFGNAWPMRKSAECHTCTDTWRRCMHAIDKKFWPNRRGKS